MAEYDDASTESTPWDLTASHGFVRGGPRDAEDGGGLVDGESCWYRIDAVNAQVEDLVHRWPDLVVSGDVAADAVLPWKVPSVAIVYGETEDAAMDDLGFVRADTPATASVLVRPVPDALFADESVLRRSMRIAPLLHLVADLVELGGDDRLEAARRFGDLEP